MQENRLALAVGVPIAPAQRKQRCAQHIEAHVLGRDLVEAVQNLVGRLAIEKFLHDGIVLAQRRLHLGEGIGKLRGFE